MSSSKWLVSIFLVGLNRLMYVHVESFVVCILLVSYPDPPPKRNGGSGEYSTACVLSRSVKV